MRKLISLDLPHVPKALDVIKAEQGFHIVYPKIGEPLDINELQKEAEPSLWEWITALAQIIVEFKQKKLLLRAISTSMMRTDAQKQVYFMSFGEVAPGNTEQEYEQDMVLLGKFIRQAFPDHPSVPLAHLTHSLTSAVPQITAEELGEHPVIKPLEFKKSVAA